MRSILTFGVIFPLVLLGDSLPLIKSVRFVGGSPNVFVGTQVGRPYDTAVIHDDVKRLWRTGRYHDIRVEADPGADGTRITFDLVAAHPRELHKILIAPNVGSMQIKLPEGSPIDQMSARAIARQAEEKLRAGGFSGARVSYEIQPYAGNKVDLVLHPEMGDRLKIESVRFAGDLGLTPDALVRALLQTRVRRLRHPAYSADAVDSDIARLRSLYITNGYYDARVHLDNVDIRKRALITIHIRSGERSTPTPAETGICRSLLAERRAAEKKGILDFNPKLHVPDLSVSVDRGRPYRVGRIEFAGLHHFTDASVRRNLVLDEAEPMDEHLLRKSLARLNRAGIFETVGAEDAHMTTNEQTGVADITINLVERKRGAWNLSGPVGPASFAGPLEGSISSRLLWGFTASVSVIAFSHPLLPALSILPKAGLLPMAAVTRPYSPGEGWKSGLVIAPQLGWRAMGLAYGTTQIQQRILPLLAGDSGLVPDLPVTVVGPGQEGLMICEAPRPRMHALRTAASFALRLLGR